MKRYLLAAVAILCLSLGVAVAQNINKALQLSQDSTGAFGIDANNHIYFPGHLNAAGSYAPALSSCGTSPTITGTDTAGVVTEGTGSPITCTLTFNKVFVSTPTCFVNAQTANTTSPLSRSMTVSALTVTHLSQSSVVWNYFCIGNPG